MSAALRREICPFPFSTGPAMIDNFTILFTTLAILYVVVRAAKLDRILPWYETRSLHEFAQKQAAEAAKKAAAKARQPVPLGSRR